MAEELTSMFFLIVKVMLVSSALLAADLIVAVLLCAYIFLKHSLLRGILNFFVKFSLET